MLCESRDLQTLDIEGCRSLVDIDCRYNHLAKLDAASFTEFMRLECEHQTILDVPASLMVKNLRAVDASGGEISCEYDEMTGDSELHNIGGNSNFCTPHKKVNQE